MNFVNFLCKVEKNCAILVHVKMEAEAEMKLYLIRHGETDYNKQKKIQGQIDIPLNARGRELAVQTGKGLAEIPFDLCFCSPLSRARETAELILKGRNVPIITDERIIEVSFGRYEGICWSPDVQEKEVPGDFQNFFDEPGKYQAPSDGESIEALIERTGDFLRDVCGREEYKDRTILVSSHGAALASMLANIKHLSVSEFWGDGCSKNCGVTEVLVTNGVPKILSENKTYY